MTGRTDDFEWLVERLDFHKGREKSRSNRAYYRHDRFETAEEIFERRRRRPSALLILLQLLPFLVAIIVFLLR